MLTAIVGILLGNLLIATVFAPALQALRGILAKFSDIELPFHSVWSVEDPPTPAERRRAGDAAREEFNRLFREYVMSFNAFKKVGAVFVTAIIILACAVAWQTPFGLRSRLLVMIIFVSAILLAGIYLQRAIAPTPSQVVSIDFLANNFANLHLDLLFNCSHLHIGFGRELLSRDPVMHFSLYQEIMFLKYRFLLVITDRGFSRVYFAAYGQPTANFQQVWTPEMKSFRIPLGDFSCTDALRSAGSFQLNLWVFIPTPKGWVKGPADHPRFLSEPITEEIEGHIGLRLVSSNCGWSSIDENLDFDRSFVLGFPRWRISRINVPADSSPQAIAQMFEKKVERVKGIKNEDYPDGIDIRIGR